MAAASLQAFLRFLSQDAKLTLSIALSKVKDFQKLNLDSREKLAAAKADDLKTLFDDEKVRKQIIAAAKRGNKNPAAGEDSTSAPPKRKRKRDRDDSPNEVLEPSLALPSTSLGEDELANVQIFTNRAPLVLAFVVTLLKHTMPDQPLSSRLSLAQGYVGTTSRARAVSLGIENGPSAEEEGFGQGQPFVTIMDKQLRVLRRWGYEWQSVQKQDANRPFANFAEGESVERPTAVSDDQPALWALDLEALKKANSPGMTAHTIQPSSQSNLPIYTPQSARAYLLKSFDSPPADAASAKRLSAAAKANNKERNLGHLLRVLDILYDSWAAVLEPEELEKRTWGWYVKIRPEVEQGVAGWGGKNVVKLADILALKRSPD